MMVVYYGFILLVAFKKDVLAAPIGDSVMTWGIPIGFGVILFTIADHRPTTCSAPTASSTTCPRRSSGRR